MTNEEAIEELKKVDTLDMPVRLCEAHYMSIKALETIPKYKDAYNKGWDDGAKATNVDCGFVWEERIDAIKTDIDKQTEIHSDGEFYIKNIDVKRIIDKHCGGENE